MILEPAESDASSDQQRVDAIVAQGPSGAFAVAGLAVAIVMAIWLAFYVFVYLARGGD
ncbi:hypothetical protein [Massilia niastensis]|uniref:hypothetical protein n=1 Tax=Massilia niastensis TaxID=544911 RepID=UPI0003829180|nr:hypothetical protein [Massilia niastensis]